MDEYAHERTQLARLPSGVEITTTVHAYGPDAAAVAAGRPEAVSGPCVYVQAAQHGREINGSVVCRRLHERLLEAELAGTVTIVPVVDPLTFDRVSYTTPERLDSVNPNMNRVWPGDADGSLHERMAATLWPHAAAADCAVDLHTGSPEMLTHTVYMKGDPDCRRLAEAFGSDLLLAEPADDEADAAWHDRDFGGKFRVAASNADVPTITPELAHARWLDEDAVTHGVHGVERVLREAGVLDGSVPAWDGIRARNHLGRVRAADSGLFRPATELGDRVEPGDRVGELFDPTSYETLQTATADRAGIVYSVAREATVAAGDTLVGVAEPL